MERKNRQRNSATKLRRPRHQPRKPWRLIFNWDSGSLFDLPGWQTDAAAFREQAIRPLLAMGADAVILGLNVTDVVFQDSAYAEYPGQHEKAFVHVRFWEGRERVKRMIETKRFQLTVLIEEGHRAGLDILASFRMNDCHDSYYSPETPLDGSPPARFKLDHPELLLGGAGWDRLCLDYARAEVRDRRFNLIRETVERFDVDGVELDFMRNGFFFAQGTGQQNAPLMTELVKRVRRLLDEVGRQRGRRLCLAVHTPVCQEISLNCGLDTRGWIEAGLVDQVIADEGCVPFTGTPLDFMPAAKAGGRCRVYSTVDFLLGTPERPEPEKGCGSPPIPWTEEQLRGWAAFQTAAGVDGLNIFNGHYANGKTLLARVFGAPRCWASGFAGDKVFVAHNRSFTANMPAVAYPALPWLPMPLSEGKTVAMDILVPEKNVPRRLNTVTLRIVFRQITVEDELTVSVNGHKVSELGKSESAQQCLIKDPARPLGEGIGERRIPLDASMIQAGRNRVEITLRSRNRWIHSPLVWKNAEIRIAE